ncbi:hypothetical protein HG536_0B05090 [Torulaspora globosa]|uniref:Uncharacterized protein n=1 Tax=Torulaspora globosa TaxID=48254 RepID=A0A7G3ZDQ8_9SACH|nr:uncharacterized protein HG536_0B05090 [Torulaspora globosa]QLL31644.1 hypothetical protein HG536_0B05090 [Torulaspora globosa]
MHRTSHSMSSAVGFEESNRSNAVVDENYDAVANLAEKPGRETGFQQHRVALSDVTSQVSNKAYSGFTNNSRKTNVDSAMTKRFKMMRNENYYTDQEFNVGNGEKAQPMRRAESCPADDSLEEGEAEGEADENDDEMRQPLYPIFDSKSQKRLDLAYKECHRSTPDPTDDDTYDVVMVIELSTDIFKYMRELEIKFRPNPNYMDSQPELKWSYRSTLIDWIVQVHSRFQLLPETLYLTVNIIDRFLSKKAVTLNRFQLVGAAALFIAAKYEEINCPTLKDIIYMLDNAYSREDIIKAERFMIDTLDFEIGWPGPMSFLRRISKADDYEYDIRTLAKYLLETTVMDPKLAAAPPSWLAAGAYFLSKVILGSNDWTNKHIYYSGYTQEQIFPLATVILENCRYADTRHQAICKKYSERRQHRSAQVVAKWISLAEKKVDTA